ncbi:cationic amino acid transporter 9 [Actinidia rufa]|uniref:Cationic amino acid transporter 9 n=1 Tax=Actinidia rufa TaxID=165716 RepID=A0A7J0FQN4_9ERIC|nr:cationic amino acid transporter 9 [Actinidia rufa]
MRSSDRSVSSSPSCFSNFWSSALRTKTLPPQSETSGLEVSGDGLVRRLSLFDLVLIGIGASIGAGIFVVTGTVAHDAGPGVTVSFILAGASCVLNALCYAELASRFPAIVGGAYLYTYTAFNELTAFLVFAQLMLDYHIGAASIARSLASYVVAILELFSFFKDKIPSWIGHGGEEFLGALSLNVLAPILLVLLTIVLCRGVGESSILNSVMTTAKIIIVIFVIIVGAFKVDVSNWSPFAPNGVKSILTGATVVFFAYVGFDAVANSAEESKRPQRDLPLGIMGSLLICAALYIGVCLVITGMVPYQLLGEEAPLVEAFTSKGLKYVSVIISIGAVAGLTTTLLVGLYVQTCYSVVSACVVTLRWKDKTSSQVSRKWISSWREGVICLIIIACCGFTAGALYRFGASLFFLIVPVVIAVFAAAALYCRQVYTHPPGFSCPWVPIVPAVCIFFNIFLFAQLHHEAWVRFVVLSIITIGIYAFYGQYHANPDLVKALGASEMCTVCLSFGWHRSTAIHPGSNRAISTMAQASSIWHGYFIENLATLGVYKSPCKIAFLLLLSMYA